MIPTATSGEARVFFERSMVEICVRMRELFDHLARAFNDVKDSLDEFFDAINYEQHQPKVKPRGYGIFDAINYEQLQPKVKPRGFGLFGSVRFSSDRSDETLRVARVLPSRRPWKCVAMPREPRRSLASGWHPERPRR